MRDGKGTYALVRQASEAKDLQVGSKGRLSVEPGWYIYVGSAFGPGGVRARVKRHVQSKTHHWHIDYLRSATTLRTVWYTHDPERRECDWAQALAEDPEVTVPMRGFGASDCLCTAHLFRVESAPDLEAFRERAHSQVGDHERIHAADPSSLSE